MHQSTKILTLSLLSCMIMACSTPVKQYDQVAVETAMPIAPSPMTQSNQGLIKAHKMIAPASYIAVMPTMERPRLEQNTEKYQNNEVNPVHRVADQAVSTFSIDVDTGSYTNTRRFLNDGRLPPVDAVRAEEMINYFDYQYPQPNSIHPFSVTTETVDSPWKQNAKLIKIGIQAKDLSTKQLPPANLVFLVDVSGSMDAADKLPLVKQTLRLLTEQLRAQDKVTIITYASGEKLVLEPTAGNQKDKILAVINALQASGATAGEQAIQLAYQQAEKAFVKNGINRILLATDGDFNVGITDFSTLKGMVAEKRKSGISLTTLGFGTGNYNEQLMEQLADAGDGNYSYIDNKNEAKKVVQRQLSSTLATVAQDVKIQVEFNPATVKEYRLVGYENRMLKQEDFNNDQVDAGDIGAGHNVTAIYEIIPVGQQGWLNDSRYQASAKTDTAKKSEYAFVNLRYKLPNQEKSILLSQAVRAESRPLVQANNDTRFAVAVASYAQQLKGGQYNGAMGWDQIIQLAQQSAKPDPYQMREEFVELAKIAKSLSARKE
ncbi:vWA domain-containing protein [Acinetobacter sp. 1000160]|uniref:vWA domain-containing protein n=1 Tax=Acinetobacter sp. 1000160 TaxID=1310800 RepID=UPI00044B8F09|nr:VWA domain-containing protein [Acinetobacter sp. 1000160]EXB46109.1 von Willebrand factor type A domain protein [Acinetobacter baumannii 146457]EYT17095.1 von Willebrand factor type A domain protein [Acinetobacter sp. 1000160]